MLFHKKINNMALEASKDSGLSEQLIARDFDVC